VLKGKEIRKHLQNNYQALTSSCFHLLKNRKHTVTIFFNKQVGKIKQRKINGCFQGIMVHILIFMGIGTDAHFFYESRVSLHLKSTL
jgi:hypothetical protein